MQGRGHPVVLFVVLTNHGNYVARAFFGVIARTYDSARNSDQGKVAFVHPVVDGFFFVAEFRAQHLSPYMSSDSFFFFPAIVACVVQWTGIVFQLGNVRNAGGINSSRSTLPCWFREIFVLILANSLGHIRSHQ